MLFIARPDLVGKIGHLAIMGGATGRGNVADHAEFNIHVDPHAAKVVMSAGAPITLATLDTTKNLRPPQSWFDAMAETGGRRPARSRECGTKRRLRSTTWL
tara:strand:- start:456 stop:758 length:303 start_codon:yes stop_codon:yes gene_type:complete